MFMVCVLLMMHDRSSVVCSDGDFAHVQKERDACARRKDDPMGTCEAIVSSDGKRWFFVHTSL